MAAPTSRAAAGSAVEVDHPSEPRDRRQVGGGRRVVQVLLGATVAVALLYVAALAVAPMLPRPKVARGGWQLYRCQALNGGSIPPELRGGVGLLPDHDMPRLTSVRDGDQVYVAATVTDATGAEVGVAVWTATWRGGGPAAPIVAVNDVARAVASNPGGAGAPPSAGAADAAASCAAKG